MTAREECTCVKLPGGGRLPMDDCPEHSRGGGQNNERKAPDVAEPRSRRTWLRCPRCKAMLYEMTGILPTDEYSLKECGRCDDPMYDYTRDAPGPSDVMAELREYVKLSRGYDGVPRTVLVNAIAEIERLEGERDGACHHINLQIKRAEKAEAENNKLRETLERLDDELSEPLWLDVALPRLRKMIANAVAAKSLEGK